MMRAAMMRAAKAGMVAVLLAQASGPQVTQPAGNMNQSQVQTNQSQQHPAASGGGASGAQVTQPAPNMNQSQVQTNQSQQPPNAR